MTKRVLNKLVSDAEALRLVTQMMAIPGRSGEEGAVQEFIVDHLRKAGLAKTAFSWDNAHKHSPIGGQVGNMALKLPGTVRGPRRMLSAHTDTVPVCLGSRPVRKGDHIRSANPNTGLGGDDRSGTAVLLCTALALLRGKLPHPPLTFLWTVQEERGLSGVCHLKVGMLGKPRLAFNFDGGSATKLTVGATGAYRLSIDVRGIASHAGGAPAEGVSAIAIASLAIANLVNNGWHGQVTKGRHSGTSNVGVIHGGEATNVVTNHVEIRAEARSHDPKFRRRIVREIGQAFKRAVGTLANTAGRHGKVRVVSKMDYESFHLSPKEPCVMAASEAVRAEGHEPELALTNGGLDANWVTAHGIPTVTLGCGQENIHCVEEALDIAQFQLARRIALRLATDWVSQ